MDDPTKVFTLDELRFVLNTELMPVLASAKALKGAINKHYRGSADETEAALARGTGGIYGEADDAPIIRLVSTMIQTALQERASDIHIEPQSARIRVRYRIDGVLRETATHPIALHGPLLSRLKIMASMDIAEKRKPQDGQISVKVLGRDLDIRASVLHSNWGETMVMRLLDKETALVSLEALGFHEDDYDRFKRIIKRPNGIFLVTGPTGSGKTTTLYSTLRYLSGPEINITTVEDPIELIDPRFCQVQVNPQIDISFASALRTILRQDPDIIMVGEIRDTETAQMAVQSALTGHLVFSTVHTRNAAGAVTRLLELGVEPFLLSSVLRGVVAQRLIRRICDRCAVEGALSTEQIAALSLKVPVERRENLRVRWGEGCIDCRHTGLFGRTGVFEMLDVGRRIRGLIKEGKDANEIAHAARVEGMEPLREAAMHKLADGITTFEEAVRLTADAE